MSEDSGGYKHFIQRGLNAARRRIEKEAPHSQISSEARTRALNLLSYSFLIQELWPDTYNLMLVMIPRMEMAGHRELWFPYLKEGIRVSQAEGDLAAHGEICLAIGYLDLLCTRLAAAKAWFQKGYQSFGQLGDQSGLGCAFNRLAVVELRNQNYSDSFMLASQALTALPPDHPERANSFYILGASHQGRQNWNEAEQHCRTALEIWQREGDQRRIAWALSNLGSALRSKGDLDDAIDYFEQALAIFNHIHDPANRAIVQMNLAIAYWHRQRHDEELVLLHHAKQVFQNLGDELNLARSSLNLGLSYGAMEKWPQAQEAYRESIRLWESLGITASLCNAIDGLGEIYLEIGEYDKAIETFEEGLLNLKAMVDHPRHDYLMNMLQEHLAQAKVEQNR